MDCNHILQVTGHILFLYKVDTPLQGIVTSPTLFFHAIMHPSMYHTGVSQFLVSSLLCHLPTHSGVRPQGQTDQGFLVPSILTKYNMEPV